MKLKTGKVAFPIEFDNGDKTTIYINPNDPNLAVRLKDFENKVSERLKELNNSKQDIEIPDDLSPENITPEMIDKIETYRKAQTAVYEEIDIAFGSPISSEVFKYCSPFAIVDDDYYILHFIRAITPEIQVHIRKTNEGAEMRMQKHLSKYTV